MHWHDRDDAVRGSAPAIVTDVCASMDKDGRALLYRIVDDMKADA